MIRGAVLALTLVAAASGAAHGPAAYTIQGSVVDRELRTPVVGAQVSLLAARRSVTTSEEGTFDFGERRLQGPDQLVISHPDYRTLRIPLGDPGGEAWRLEITVVRAEGTGDGGWLSGRGTR